MGRAATWIAVAAGLLIFGLARLPFERSLETAQRAAFLRPGSPELGLRIEAHTAWEQTAWGRMAGLFRTVTSLQPRSPTYWDLASWHMAWNASVAARENPKEPSEFLRRRAEREYQMLGKEFLEQGIANNPDRYMLHERLGILLRDKLGDHEGAAEALGKAAKMREAPAYVKRLAAYELSAVKGREREAYVKLCDIYDMGGDERKPRVLALLHELEENLGIAPGERRVPVAPE
jgi:hypothetical protein